MFNDVQDVAGGLRGQGTGQHYKVAMSVKHVIHMDDI